MSDDTIYLRQFLDLWQASLRDLVGVNLADVRELQDALNEKVMKFNKGIIAENEAADFSRKTWLDTLEYSSRVDEELKLLQEEHKKGVQYSSKTDEFLNAMSEEQKSRILNENERIMQLQITALENLMAEIKRLYEMAGCITAHIQDFAITPEYRERRKTFLFTGEAPDHPVPVDNLTDKEILEKLEDTGFILKGRVINDRQIYVMGRAITVPKIYDEILKMTKGDVDRVKRFMQNYISGTEAGLKQHLARLRKKNNKK